MPTTFDFNRHLDQSTIHIKNIAGMADYQRGQVKNIRTAAEANMVQSSVQGRMNVRTRVLTKFVRRGFDKALDINAAIQLDSTLTVGVDDTGYDY